MLLPHTLDGDTCHSLRICYDLWWRQGFFDMLGLDTMALRLVGDVRSKLLQDRLPR